MQRWFLSKLTLGRLLGVNVHVLLLFFLQFKHIYIGTKTLKQLMNRLYAKYEFLTLTFDHFQSIGVFIRIQGVVLSNFIAKAPENAF